MAINCTPENRFAERKILAKTQFHSTNLFQPSLPHSVFPRYLTPTSPNEELRLPMSNVERPFRSEVMNLIQTPTITKALDLSKPLFLLVP